MTAGVIQAGRAAVEAFLDTGPLQKQLGQMGRSLQSAGRRITSVGTAVAGVGAAITSPFIAATKVFANYGDKLDKISARTGVSVESISTLGFAAEQTGGSMENVEQVLLKMNRRLGRVTSIGGPAKAAMEELGLSVDQIAAMSPEERFLAIGEAMRNYGDDAAAAGLAQRALGTGVDKLLPLFKLGADGIEELRQQARDLGLEVGGDQATSAAELTDAWNAVTKQFRMVAFTVGGALAPALTKALGVISEILPAVIKWTQENAGLFQVIAGVGAALVAGGTALAAFGSAVTLLGMGLTALGGLLAFVATPFGAITLAAAAGVTALFAFTDAGKQLWEVLDDIGTIFGGITDALSAGEFALAGEIAMTSLELAFFNGLNSVADMFDKTFEQIFKFFGIGTEDMASVWDGFVENLVGAFQAAARVIIDTWASTVSGLSNLMIDLAMQEGAIGDAMAGILGIDMRETQRELSQGDRDRLAMLQNRLQELEAERTALIESGAEISAQENTLQDLDKLIANQREAIASAGGTTDATALAKETAAAIIGQQRTLANEWVSDTGDFAIRSFSREGLRTNADERLAALQAQLIRARTAAAEARQEEAQEPSAMPPTPMDVATEVATFSTFNARQLGLAAAGGGAFEDRIIDQGEEQNKILREINGNLSPD